MKQVTLPAGTRRHLDRVIPYALEEELISDIEQLHFSWSTPSTKSQQPIAVAVVADEVMQRCQQWLAKADIEADVWTADYLLLPYQEQHWTLLQLGNNIIARTDQWHGFAQEAAQFDSVAKAVSEAGNNPVAITQFGELEWSQPLAPLTTGQAEIPVAALALGEASALELRRGRYRVSKKSNQELRWQPLAVAASVALLLLIGGNWLRAVQLNSQATALEQQAEQNYKDAFPGQTRIVNLRVQLQRQLDRVGASADQRQSALALLQALQPAFAQQSQMTLELLRFQRGELRLQALASSFADFEQFQRQAQRAGLTVEQGALNNRGGRVAGTLTIAAGEPS